MNIFYKFNSHVTDALVIGAIATVAALVLVASPARAQMLPSPAQAAYAAQLQQNNAIAQQGRVLGQTQLQVLQLQQQSSFLQQQQAQQQASANSYQQQTQTYAPSYTPSPVTQIITPINYALAAALVSGWEAAGLNTRTPADIEYDRLAANKVRYTQTCNTPSYVKFYSDVPACIRILQLTKD
ncbi:hypothetical protein [Variovorax sp. LG9.2]|uniref:hypothetical protein n=1 Tax=Variovorax sp. LG9.2 TaxID=3048626 RepID=UPI002B238E6C|nr:hypothetical protein [Variovorax sp. LG9.2]MEB0057295.1 hypothetical protein [Variovorax sp. LG9.2]